MTTLKAIQFAANVTIGSLIKANGITMLVEKITANSFEGRMIHKGTVRGKAVLSFSTLTNPHYCKNISVR